jgi:hypothetical protein
VRVDPQSLGPFYPAQVASGETYVVDNRTQKVAETIDGSFDTVERWTIAKKRAAKLNAQWWNRRRVVTNRLRLGTLFALMAACILALVMVNF